MIIIFGAKGFVGTYLTTYLKEKGIEHYATDKDDVDVTKQEQFEKLPKADIVIHLACIQPATMPEYEPNKIIETNVIGTLNILEYCKKVGARIIYFNSRKLAKGEYGIYSISEQAAKDCIEYYHREYGMNYTVFRIPMVLGYGGYEEYYKNGVKVKSGFQTFVDQAKKGYDLVVWGDNEITRPIIYVKDLVSAVMVAVENHFYKGSYDVWSVKRLSLGQEAEDIAEVFSPAKSKAKVFYAPYNPNGIENTYDIKSNWLSATGWKPKYNTFRDILIDFKKESEI